MECHLWVLNIAHLICTETGDKSDGLNLDSEIYTLVIVCLKHASIYRYIYILYVLLYVAMCTFSMIIWWSALLPKTPRRGYDHASYDLWHGHFRSPWGLDREEPQNFWGKNSSILKKHTLPETDIAPEDGPSQKGNFIFQPWIFRDYVSFTTGSFKILKWQPVGMIFLPEKEDLEQSAWRFETRYLSKCWILGLLLHAYYINSFYSEWCNIMISIDWR